MLPPQAVDQPDQPVTDLPRHRVVPGVATSVVSSVAGFAHADSTGSASGSMGGLTLAGRAVGVPALRLRALGGRISGGIALQRCTLKYLALKCLALGCFVLGCFVLGCLVLGCLVLGCPALGWLVLGCPALGWLTPESRIFKGTAAPGCALKRCALPGPLLHGYAAGYPAVRYAARYRTVGQLTFGRAVAGGPVVRHGGLMAGDPLLGCLIAACRMQAGSPVAGCLVAGGPMGCLIAGCLILRCLIAGCLIMADMTGRRAGFRHAGQVQGVQPAGPQDHRLDHHRRAAAADDQEAGGEAFVRVGRDAFAQVRLQEGQDRGPPVGRENAVGRHPALIGAAQHAAHRKGPGVQRRRNGRRDRRAAVGRHQGRRAARCLSQGAAAPGLDDQVQAPARRRRHRSRRQGGAHPHGGQPYQVAQAPRRRQQA